jgi:hypothetical protein
MKNRRNILIVAALSILVTSASSSSAPPAQTYHGTLTDSTFYCNGEESPDFRPTVTGTWNLIIDPQTPAQLTLDVFVNGRHDVAFGNNALMLISHDDGVYVFSAFGGFAMATLDTSVTPAKLSWHVEFGVSCPDQNHLRLADVLRSGEPRRWVRVGPGSCEFTQDLKSSVKAPKPTNQTKR